ncbi:MAG: tRNA (adenosine(37)-N6)-threonylcarbamoyltransferase complex ATPase subunit type 1 TsaE [Spirosomaceae bacterium]|nr:tRNA (adenosine(37)-N6)-threonylcarbamoyltransferase complex ATPase subunit type 1 TsaE [Spirosomataceae bacterium]
MIEYIVEQLSDLPEIAKKVIKTSKNKHVWCFDGEMGAGKTTFIQAICKELGVEAAVQSPTFSIVNEYVTSTDQTIYHFDCYRLKSVNEALDIGIEEYLYSGNYCFIEWAERITPLLPDDIAVVKIQEIEDEKRKITVTLPK